MPTDVQSSFVADADGVRVITRGMCAHHVERATLMNYPVASDVVVIANVGKTTDTMVTTAVVHGVTLRGTGGTTMYHNQVDATEILILAAGQDGIAHNIPQACMPRAVAKAVSTVIVIFRILPQMVLFSFSIIDVVSYSTQRRKAAEILFKRAEYTEFFYLSLEFSRWKLRISASLRSI